MSIISEAYKKIFDKDPEGMEEWKIAEEIINKFDVPKMGKDMAKQVIFQIVNHIDYPNRETTVEIVGRAEGLASELFEELLGDEPNMSELEWLENKYWENKNKGPKII